MAMMTDERTGTLHGTGTSSLLRRGKNFFKHRIYKKFHKDKPYAFINKDWIVYNERVDYAQYLRQFQHVSLETFSYCNRTCSARAVPPCS